jgi:hypothetical protein
MRPFVLLVAIGVFAGLTACGGSETTETVTIVQTEAAAATSRSADPADPSPTRDGDGDNKLVMPDVAGQRLDVAESELDDLDIPYEEVGGGTFGVIDTSAWTVCATKPKAGKRVGETVKLIVARPGECGNVSNVDEEGGSPDEVPDLIGLRLDIAESELEDLGIPYEEVGGGTFGVLNRSNWVVCETRPEPGERAEGVVKLIVDRSC